jgi:hypothetical protein
VAFVIVAAIAGALKTPLRPATTEALAKNLFSNLAIIAYPQNLTVN